MTAELLRLRGDADAAIPEYHNALKLNPESAIALQRLGDAYRNLGKTTEAAAAYKAALEKDKTNVDAGGSLVDIYDRSGATTDSLALYPLLIEQKKSVPIFRIRYARALLKSGNKSEAKSQAEEALKIDPNNRQAMEIMDEAGK